MDTAGRARRGRSAGPPDGAAESSRGPSLAIATDRTGCYPLPSAAPRPRATAPDRSTGWRPVTRSWPSDPEAAPRDPDSARRCSATAARPRRRGRRRRARRRAPTRHADRRRRGARGRARGAILAEEKAAEAARKRSTPARSVDAARSASASSIAVAAAEEYAYVARDVRRIAIVGGGMILILLALWLVVHLTGFSVLWPRRRRGRRARATIGPCHPPDGRPAHDPRPSSSHRPSASRWPRGCARALSTSSSARSTSSASAARSGAASPAATSRRCCCGAHRGPARRASPACWRPRSAPTSRRCRAVMSGVVEVRATIAEAQERLAPPRHAERPLPRRDPSLQQGPAGRAPPPRRGRDGHARSARRPRTPTSRSTRRSCRGCASGGSRH